MSQFFLTALFALALGFLTVAASFADLPPDAVPIVAVQE